MAIYTQRLFQEKGLTGSESVQVPNAHVWIVRSIDVYTNPLLSAELFIEGALGQTFAYFVDTFTSGLSPHWDGRQVLYEGETLTAHAGSGTWDVTISGYVFTI